MGVGSALTENAFVLEFESLPLALTLSMRGARLVGRFELSASPISEPGEIGRAGLGGHRRGRVSAPRCAG